MPAQNYVKKVEAVTAIQYDGTNKAEILEFGEGRITELDEKLIVDVAVSGGCRIEILVSNWVTKDVSGNLDVFDEDTFLLYYKPGGPVG